MNGGSYKARPRWMRYRSCQIVCKQLPPGGFSGRKHLSITGTNCDCFVAFSGMLHMIMCQVTYGFADLCFCLLD